MFQRIVFPCFGSACWRVLFLLILSTTGVAACSEPCDEDIALAECDLDGDGVGGDVDEDNEDPCVPKIAVAACDFDEDGTAGDVDDDNDDPCVPSIVIATCDYDGDGSFGDTDSDNEDPCVPSLIARTCDYDDDGSPGNVDPDNEDPCTPGVDNVHCDFDEDGVTGDTDADNRDPCVPSSAVAVCDPMPIDADVDTDRNGTIDDADDVDEELWTDTRGAVLFGNVDNDAGVSYTQDTIPGDGYFDSVINGPGDRQDMVELVVHAPAGDYTGAVVSFRLNEEASRFVRIFGPNDAAIYEPGVGSAYFSVENLGSQTYTFLIESLDTRLSFWDGLIEIQVIVGRDGLIIGTDAVSLRVAPLIFPDNLNKSGRLFVMGVEQDNIYQITNNDSFISSLATNLPTDVELVVIPGADYGYDVWVQDTMQTGYQELPDSSATDGRRTLKTHLQAARFRELFPLLLEDILNGDIGWGYQASNGQETSLSYGGNIEIAPPHTGYPLGRILVGGGEGGTILGVDYSDTMDPDQRGLLDAQGVQGPTLELSTEWLAVGHLDEIFLAVADRSDTANRSWKFLVASPDLARLALQGLLDAGQGNLPIFEGRTAMERDPDGPTTIVEDAQTSVSELLSNSDLLAFNDSVQARIDSVQLIMQDRLGLTADDFIALPVLYRYDLYDMGGGQAFDLSVALSPGVQNLIVVDNKLFIPDPEGPDFNGVDVWQQQILDAIAPLQYEAHFVDVFETYHQAYGEAHCGSNMERDDYATTEYRWWEGAAP